MAGDDPTPFLVSFPAVVAPIAILADAAGGLGATNWLPDHDQIVRRVPLFVLGPSGPTPSLALEALRLAQGETTYVIKSSNASGESALGQHTGVNAIAVGSMEIATGANADVQRRCPLHSNAARVISAARLLHDRVDRSEIDGRIILVGTLAAGLGDVRATPLDASTPGVEIHAHSSIFFSGASPVEAGLGRGGGIRRRPPVVRDHHDPRDHGPANGDGGQRTGGDLRAVFRIFFLFERYGLLLDPLYPSAAVLCAYTVGGITLWQFERVAKRQVHQAFGKFLSPLVVDRLVEHPERLVLGGETRELTVLFSGSSQFFGLPKA